MFAKYWIVALILLVMGGGGAAHLMQPALFTGFVFAPFPPTATVIVAGFVQIGIAIMALLPGTRARAGLFFAVLCLGYMPLHIWDLFRDDPMIAPLSAAIVRIFIQVFFIWAGLRLWKKAAE